MNVAFVDRDGTIINDYENDEWRYIDTPVFIHGSLEGLKEIRKKGYQVIIITNQYLINDGIITLSQYKIFTERFIHELNKSGINTLDIFYCPHSIKENCNCFKPKTGLIDMAFKKYPTIDLSKSFVVGDSLCDVELGNRLGIKTFGINVKSKIFSYIELNSLQNIIRYL